MAGGSLIDDANMSFMGQMALALGKLSNLEGFVIQVMVSHQILNLKCPK
jgi:transcription factor TGA